MHFEQQLLEDRAVANKGLEDAIAESGAIADETERLRSVHRAINVELGKRDREWERRTWFNQNVDAMVAWAAGAGKLPSLKPLETSEHEEKVLLIALEHTVLKLMVQEARAHASLSEELKYKSQLTRLSALEAHFKAKEFLESGSDILGDNVDLNNSPAERLQIEADELLNTSEQERQIAKELKAALPNPAKKGATNVR
jgi:hypothetical protein